MQVFGQVWLAVSVALALAPTFERAAFAQTWDTASGSWSFGGQIGAMTENRANDVYKPGELEFADAGFAGLILGYEAPLGSSRFWLGGEFQINQHFGSQSFQEFAVPVTVRYRPAQPWPVALESLAFGIGASHTTERPQIEIDVRGDAGKTMVYWMVESAFSVGDGGNAVFVRLHHRSDAFGLLEPDSGSNAFAFGFRKGF